MRRKIVLAPDLIAGAFLDANCRAVLEQWRDGNLAAACNRELLLIYLRLLRELGCGPQQVRWWSLWFTSPEKSLYLPELETGEKSPLPLCARLASLAQANEVVTWRESAPQAGTSDARFLTAEAFVRLQRAPAEIPNTGRSRAT